METELDLLKPVIGGASRNTAPSTATHSPSERPGNSNGNTEVRVAPAVREERLRKLTGSIADMEAES